MKQALIIIAIVLAAALALWVFRDDPPPATIEPDQVDEPEAIAPEQTAPEQTTPEQMPPAEEPGVEPAPQDDAQFETPTTEPGSMLDQARDEADEAAEAAESAIAQILEQQEEAAAEAEAAAQAAIDEALAAGDEAAAEAEATVGQAEQSMREQMEATEPEADPLTQPTATDPELLAAEAEGVFTPEGFDFDRAMGAIERSDLDPINMSAARALLESVRNDPDALEAALSQLRDMLGLS